MAGNQSSLLLSAALLTLLAVSSASATFISEGDALESRGSTGRSLLQAKKNEDEAQNYMHRGGDKKMERKRWYSIYFCMILGLFSLAILIYGCPLNFELMNYTTITSKCKGPKYPANLCCAAFKEFACPYAEQINDGSNECAPTMFSYINLHGNYPPGLFASECREGKEGLECPPLPDTSGSSSTEINESLQSLIIHISGFVTACLLSFRF